MATVVWVLLGINGCGWLSILTSPRTFIFLYEHLKIKVTASDFSTKVGQEWYPYDSWEFFGNSVVACIAMVVGYLAFDPSDRKRRIIRCSSCCSHGAHDHDWRAGDESRNTGRPSR